MKAPWAALLLALAAAAPARASVDALPQFARNMPLYPGMYFNARWFSDERDRVFDAQGRERDSAIPTLPDPTRFPMQALQAEFLWHFPMFETYGLLWFSERTHFARVQLNYVQTRTEGALTDFAANEAADGDGDVDNADDLRSDGSGIGDLFVEYGGYIYGSPTASYRERERTPLAILIAFGGSLPFGVYDRDAPVSAGGNTFWIQSRLGLHAQPWPGGFVDADYGYREYFKNQDAAYMALDPRQQGDDRFWSLSIGQRLARGLYLSVFASDRRGQPNQYRDLRFAPNSPPDAEPEDDATGTQNYDKLPAPGAILHDRGTARRSAGLGVEYFLSQKLRLGLHYETPLSGRSGEIDVQWVQRTPAGCTVGADGCDLADAEVLRADGTGAARVYATDRLMVTLNYQFGLRDVFSCPGCSD